ncbi:MAG: ABC transporter substrate-binding protein [Phycisphaeraceae bacterium]|nr:ABC transporter substrate-binding protein [Phycisphaerae bacterium]MBX3392490.1 ABC transporter substrate-binding protein [Phycisphaeraceae bacterium]
MRPATRGMIAVRILAWVVAAGSLAWVGVLGAGCGESPDPAASGKTARGGASATTSTPDLRIVALSPALAITIRDLGLAERIVGRHGYDLALDPAIPVCGDQAGIDYEALIRARPTHIVMQWGSRDLPPKLGELATAHGWTILNYDLLTLNDVRASAVELHDVLAGPESERLGQGATVRTTRSTASPPAILDRLESAFRRRGAGFAGAGRVLMLLSASPVAAVGPGSFHQQALETIGGIPALARGGPYQELDIEDVIRLAPDAIVLLRPRGLDAPSATGPLSIERRDQLLGTLAGRPIPAVENGRIAVIDDPLCLLPGSSLVVFADDMARILSQWSLPAGP